MKRQELSRLLRMASQITEDDQIVVVGSQAILGSVDEARLPSRATLSQEVDLMFLHDGDRRKADLVNVHIGEMSPVQEELGIYAEGVHRETIVLPTGWRKRTIAWHLEPGATRFLERHDLCASKLARGEMKDLAFVGALVGAGLIETAVMVARCRMLQAEPAVVQAAVTRASAFVGQGPAQPTARSARIDPRRP
ncbi:DUF6036 family nucleotidyltransferase [Agrococcus sp. ARC_14]|uniref:DUF6036 family nucleotidyltransferase n=1 Tax=Agrococcus sp. ARC_14 TaxID=2919927 RepID=UPI001F05FC57|nr:DUF6036 family nucleotidyltransferase [Agrococcus sp. ARC_14]MCH1881328.1 hypothetical protein [Agrococcus sp. ARC_14]